METDHARCSQMDWVGLGLFGSGLVLVCMGLFWAQNPCKSFHGRRDRSEPGLTECAPRDRPLGLGPRSGASGARSRPGRRAFRSSMEDPQGRTVCTCDLCVSPNPIHGDSDRIQWIASHSLSLSLALLSRSRNPAVVLLAIFIEGLGK